MLTEILFRPSISISGANQIRIHNSSKIIIILNQDRNRLKPLSRSVVLLWRTFPKILTWNRISIIIGCCNMDVSLIDIEYQ